MLEIPNGIEFDSILGQPRGLSAHFPDLHRMR